MNTESNTLYMTRCDYDAMFYRVFCITLLAIAFTFTVILTSVFIDIDGLLVGKKENLNHNTIRRNEFTTEASDNDDMNYVDSGDSYRTKRSIETQSFLFHVKNPRLKNILANRLSTLLEELEAEESEDIKASEKNITIAKTEETTKVAEMPKLVEDESKEKMLHLSMHNVLLQGMDRNLDLNDVYKKLFASMSNFKNIHGRKDESRLQPFEIEKDGENPKLPRPFEKFFDEMLNNNKLKEQTIQTTTVKPVQASPNIVIKTVINITSTGHNKVKENYTKISNENIQGAVELVYNGKVIKFTHPDAEIEQPPPEKKLPITLNPKRTIETTNTDYLNMIPKSFMNKFVEEYLKHFPHDTKENTSNEINQHFQTKRLKRHVRIKYANENSGETKKTFKKNTEEDELYVEIETHFDSKGMKGEKKKKLIKSLIAKIQKALHSDIPCKPVATGKNNTRQKTRKRVHFRKRTQNPLEPSINHVFVNKKSLPISIIGRRDLHPISKTVSLEDTNAPAIGTKSGEEWKKTNLGPGFLASTKAINSAEMSELNVDYSKILEVNGIPQRLQQPLNTELSEETIKTNSYYDMGKTKYVIKDIDGSGFSVGFNQYVDEPPDKESLRLFSGLENVLKSYHQTYDSAAESIPTTEALFEIEERRMEPTSDEHIIERRSIDKEHDYHSNEYKIVLNDDFMPYKDYRDIYKSKPEKHKHTQKKSKKSPGLVLDENIFEKNLKPSEILSLANLFDRKKRAVNMNRVKVVSNLRSRRKVNRFLNTNTKSKTIFLNTKRKRNKRQINKIRIIATDLPRMSHHSDENVFVVSDENVMADRALIKEFETSEEKTRGEIQEDTQYFDSYPNDNPNSYNTKIFNGRSRNNPLMSKYPHIFMEEISRSPEDDVPNNALQFDQLPVLGKRNYEADNNDDDKIDIEQFVMPAIINDTTESRNQFREQDMISALIASPFNKPNYKVTVKITPKNQTSVNSGFKEIHTSINKSFNRNGLLYSSLVNVSEISKVVNLNRSNDKITDDNQNLEREESLMTQKIQDQQEKMQFLLKQHAKHINEQLHRLYEEKMNLESMFNDDNNTDIYKYALNLTTRRQSAAAKVEVTTTTTEDVKEVQPTTVPPTPRVELTPSTTTQSHTTKIQYFEEKVRNNNIISKIERNGNLTDAILKKIDRNTEILQVFLQKLTERIEATSTVSLKPEIVKNDHDTHPMDRKNHEAGYTQNMVIRKNDSHISIPFTYAYQPATALPVKSKVQVASVVYQGHIRNPGRMDIPHSEQENQLQNVQKVNNQSKFFIDDLENSYKIIQMGGLQKKGDYHLVRNSTST